MIDNNDFSQTVTNYFKNDYRERGKIKWNGYFLSDHTSSLKNDSNERHTVTTKLKQMPLNEMKDQLQFALVNYLNVTVQQNYQDASGQMLANITGLVDSLSERKAIVNGEQILFENMRAVKINDDN